MHPYLFQDDLIHFIPKSQEDLAHFWTKISYQFLNFGKNKKSLRNFGPKMGKIFLYRKQKMGKFSSNST